MRFFDVKILTRRIYMTATGRGLIWIKTALSTGENLRQRRRALS
jgi:hypothetical protein